MGRWNSALMVFLSKCADLCRLRVEMGTSGLPPGAANLLRLARTAADKQAPASGALSATWLERVGGRVLAFAGGAGGFLTFLGECAVALFRLLRGRAQFRWTDTFLVMQECGPQALG